MAKNDLRELLATTSKGLVRAKDSTSAATGSSPSVRIVVSDPFKVAQVLVQASQRSKK